VTPLSGVTRQEGGVVQELKGQEKREKREREKRVAKPGAHR
jgi:hypothetical protein